MSLNLGLESLGIVTDDVSYESVLQAEIAFSDAQISFERACFQAATEARNVHNFNEIIDSLQRHSSQECVAFAQDLLGTTSLEKIELPGTPPAKTFKERAKGAWDAFVNFIKTCFNFIKKWTGKLLAKLHLYTEKGFEGKMKVNYSLADLNAFAEAVPGPGGIAVTSKTIEGSSVEKVLRLGFLVKKPKKTDIDLSNVNSYVEALQKAQTSLWYLLRSLSGSAKFGTTTTKNDKGNAVSVDQKFAGWFVGLIKRLKPFQKGIMSDFVTLMNRARLTASADASAINKLAKKSENGGTIAASKVSTRYGGEKE